MTVWWICPQHGRYQEKDLREGIHLFGEPSWGWLTGEFGSENASGERGYHYQCGLPVLVEIDLCG